MWNKPSTTTFECDGFEKPWLVEYQYYKGDSYPVTCVTIQPPDPEYVDVVDVFGVDREGKNVSIYGCLTGTLISEIEEFVLDEIRGERDDY